ncbi:hypothetical protein GCM10023115_26170 [Pontixanthobacter gangjinensis]|uniref:Tetratricopeptide repeat protein n=1 Tax=Christiangramia aestuarii TaxID=1028746 RepID=A0A7K1LM96_9FLAO|nr:tetratricopeptide repeat protein [Christiangramia aestuarii]MUP41853.1 tetratricopeptide repeat protein [Christiangramia aestuarii]
MSLNNYYKELKRRNVFKAALAYIVVCWIILQVISIVFPMFGIPNNISKAVLFILIIGFPIWLVFAWVYEVTPDGLKKTENVKKEQSIIAETSSKFNKLILGALAIAIILLAINVYGTYSDKNSSQENSKSQEVVLKENPEEELEKSIAVLAFENMTSDEEQEYFSDGISEEILNYLAKNPELTVISRTSSFSFKNKAVDIQTIGEKLNTNYILEGSVRKADSMVRITVQLIQVNNGAHLWSETYDRKMQDIFAIQDEIAEKVTRNLEVNLLGLNIPSVDIEAYNKFLQAKEIYLRFTKESFERASRLINEAVQIDSNYAPIWLYKAGIRLSEGYIREFTEEEEEELLERVISEIERAIKIDPDYAHAYASLAEKYQQKGDYVTAKKYFEKAFKLQPNDDAVLQLLSRYQGLESSQVTKLARKSVELDPLEGLSYLHLALALFYEREYEECLNAFDIYLVYYPYTLGIAGFHAEFFAMAGKKEEAYKALKKETFDYSLKYTPMILAVIFNDPDKEKLIEQFIQTYGESNPYGVAQAYAYQNKKKEAYKWLEKAISNKIRNIFQIKKDPYMDNLREDKRFKELLTKIEFPEPLDIDLSRIKLNDQ